MRHRLGDEVKTFTPLTIFHGSVSPFGVMTGLYPFQSAAGRRRGSAGARGLRAGSAAWAVGAMRVSNAPPAAAAAPVKKFRRFIKFSSLSVVVVMLFAVRFIDGAVEFIEGTSRVRLPPTALSSWARPANNHAMPHGLPLAECSRSLAEQFEVRLLHRVVVQERLAQDALALRQ
jgi:hypothetical protein